MEILNLIVDQEDGERLDMWLADSLEEVSRSKVKAWCKDGLVKVNGKVRKGSYNVNEGDEVEVQIPEPETLDTIIPEDIPLDIVFEDEHLILINKQPGMVVHPGAGIYTGTLVHALAFHFEKLAKGSDPMRPGIIHRLDKGTSGLILVAKTDFAHAEMSRQWKAHEVTKVYQTLVWGIPNPGEGEVETNIGRHPRFRRMMAADVEGGRHSVSRFKVTEAFTEAAKVNVHILTGRTHQVRVHMAHVGHPVVGDALYGRNRHKNLAKTFPNMPDHPMLHAALLRFKHPKTGKELTFKQPLPAEFEACAQNLSRWPY